MLEKCQHMDVLESSLVKITKYEQSHCCSPRERDCPLTGDMYPEELVHKHDSQRAPLLSLLRLSEI